MPTPTTDRCGGSIVFSGCPSVIACLHVPGHHVLPVSIITPEWVEGF